MEQFFVRRLSYHQKKIMKYMKYVFNDHFVLVSTFLLGGLGLYYSQLVKTLPSHFVWGYPIILLVWFFALNIGKVATLIEPADEVFLLPKEIQMNSYLKRSLYYSMLLPSLVCIIFVGISMPLYVAVSGQRFQEFFWFLFLLLFLKIFDLCIQLIDIFQIDPTQSFSIRIGWILLALAAMTTALYWSPLLGLVIASVSMIFSMFFLSYTFKKYRLNWDRMVRKEQSRMHRIYRFIHLFTDVPEMTGNVKRRKWADVLFKKIPIKQKQTYLYLYGRSFVRGSEYSGLFFRLTLIGSLLVLFVPEFWFVLILSVLLVYLIGFQLLPLYHQFDYMIMTQLYPLPLFQRQKGITVLLNILLVVTAFIFGALSFFSFQNALNSLLLLVALLVEVFLFTSFYLPYRLKKV